MFYLKSMQPSTWDMLLCFACQQIIKEWFSGQYTGCPKKCPKINAYISWLIRCKIPIYTDYIGVGHIVKPQLSHPGYSVKESVTIILKPWCLFLHFLIFVIKYYAYYVFYSKFKLYQLSMDQYFKLQKRSFK